MMKLYTNTMAFLYTYKNDERGVTAIEYGLIGVAMAVLLAAVLSGNDSMLTKLTDAYDGIKSSITTVYTKSS